MTLENYITEHGVTPVSTQTINTYGIVSSIDGVLTYDDKIGINRQIKPNEVPLDINGFIDIKDNTSIPYKQLKLELQTSIGSYAYPDEETTLIVKGKINKLYTTGTPNLIITDDSSEDAAYSWKLLQYDNKIELRKFTFRKYDRSNFDTTLDEYVELVINNTFNINDEIIYIIRFKDDVYNVNNNIMNIDIKVGSTIILGGSIGFPVNIVTTNTLRFYDDQNKIQSNFLLSDCIKIKAYLSDSEVLDVLNNSDQIGNTTNSNQVERENSNTIKRKTVIVPLLNTTYEIIPDSEVPDNKKVYIHDFQIRHQNTGILFQNSMSLNDTGTFTYTTLQGQYTGVQLEVPPEGYWDNNTTDMGTTGSLKSSGMQEQGGGLGKGVEYNISLSGVNIETYVTVYYTIE